MTTIYCPKCNSQWIITYPSNTGLTDYRFMCTDCKTFFNLDKEIEMTTEKLKPTKENVFAICAELSDSLNRKPRLDEMRNRFTRPNSHNIAVYRKEWLADNKDRFRVERQSVKQLRNKVKELEADLDDETALKELLRKEIEALRQTIKDIEVANKNLKENREKLVKAYTRKIAELEGQVVKLKHDLNEEVASYCQRIEELKEENTKLQAEVNQYKYEAEVAKSDATIDLERKNRKISALLKPKPYPPNTYEF